MHLLKWLYPGMKFKRWLALFALGVMMVSLGLALVFNYKYLDAIEEAIFRAVYLWRGSYNYTFTTLVGLLVVALGVLLTAFGVYDRIARHGGAGTLVPITGFANAVASPALEFKTEGYITGTAVKMFTIAGPVIVYGIVASVVYGVALMLLG